MKGQLDGYKKKRNFEKTSEPEGEVSQGSGNMFVVQEHFARRHHFDFRLEINGVLKSWAVPKGPSLNPEDKRLAVHVEDHPLDYGEFEGVIPKGQYGGGKVILWDKGVWQPLSGDPQAALKAGKIEFKLLGKKLAGTWVLARTKMGNNPNNWLLIKKKDNTANENLDIVRARPESVKGHNDHFNFKPQLAERTKIPPSSKRYLHEVKYDGYRTVARVKNGRIDLYTRNGHNWTHKYPTIARALMLDINETVLDGEIVYLDSNGRSNFGELQRALKEFDLSSIYYYLFDIVKLDGESIEKLPLELRKVFCEEFVKWVNNDKIVYSEHLDAPGKDVFSQCCELGLEGIISKDATASYIHSRSPSWRKVKCENTEEFLIVGYIENEDHTLKSLVLGINEDGTILDIGSVGAGLNLDSRSELQKILLKDKVDSPSVKSNRKNKVVWVTPKLYAQVQFTEMTKTKKLRHPVYQGLREDLNVKDSKLLGDQINELITSPTKLVFPKGGITKLDLANYYNEIYPLMQSHINGRVLNLLKCPKGAQEKCFFNKHIGNMKNLSEVHVKDQVFFTVNNLKGLMHLVRYNALEIHTWNCSAQNNFSPKEIVFDLDPDEKLEASKIIEAAFEIRNILAKLNLLSFPKVTGGKGVHIHVPIAPIYPQDKVYNFSKSVSLLLEEQNPKLYTTNIRKSERGSKIFIDYLRNNFGASYIGPYSTRVTPYANLCLPVSWKTLRSYDLRDPITLNAFLAKTPRVHPWENYWSLGQEIEVFSNES
ncbi:MAG: DNA ligase D [Halobacteriovoraceae bacterium]|nr:DNA ligase D [Halobacteriovoraceae bacterium]|tara:strand:- start:45339 stop:47636 length:2298 start_codon:yes stop_codon:yes gene_type:complete